jgi:hypothetical protein
MTKLAAVNTVRSDVLDALFLLACGVVFWYVYQEKNYIVTSDTCISYDQETFASVQRRNVSETIVAQINDLSHLDTTFVEMHYHEYLPKSAANHSDSSSTLLLIHYS